MKHSSDGTERRGGTGNASEALLWGGDDDAITTPSADAFGRAPFAKHLTEVIRSAPEATSFRIGIFGEWGEGKTSVMSLMEHYLPSDDYVCIRIGAWDVTTARDIVTRVAAGLASIAGTDRGIAAGLTSLMTRVGAGQQKLRQAAAETHWAVKGIDRLFGDVVENAANKKAAKAVRSQVDAAIERLGRRRAVVFVDDLDRADASGLPRVLMALREAVPVPGTVFVVALSASAVENAIEKSNYGLESAERFLEKIIEYPAHLPPIPPEALRSYSALSIQQVKGLRNPDTLTDLAEFLPRNPRRLKRFLRKLSALRGTLERFDDAELNWFAVYVAQLLLSEFPREAHRLREDASTLKAMESTWVDSVFPANGASTRERPEERFAPDESEQRAQFLALCDVIRTQHWIGTRYRVKSILHLDSAPPILTVREASRIVEEFGGTPSELRSPFLRDALTREGPTSAEMIRAFWWHLLDFQQDQIAKAFRTLHAEERLDATSASSTLTEIMELLVSQLNAFGSGWLGMPEWAGLLDVAGPWANARVQRNEADTLERELGLIEQAVADAPLRLADLALRQIREDRRYGVNGERPNAYRNRMQLIAERLEQSLCREVLTRFLRPDGTAVYASCDWDEHQKWFVFSSSSLVYRAPHIEELQSLGEDAASGSAVIQRNFVAFLNTLAEAANGRVNGVEQREATAILCLPGVAACLWHGAVARATTATGAQRLEDIRSQMVALGIADADLPIPGWWP